MKRSMQTIELFATRNAVPSTTGTNPIKEKHLEPSIRPTSVGNSSATVQIGSERIDKAETTSEVRRKNNDERKKNTESNNENTQASNKRKKPNSLPRSGGNNKTNNNNNNNNKNNNNNFINNNNEPSITGSKEKR